MACEKIKAFAFYDTVRGFMPLERGYTHQDEPVICGGNLAKILGTGPRKTFKDFPVLHWKYAAFPFSKGGLVRALDHDGAVAVFEALEPSHHVHRVRMWFDKTVAPWLLSPRAGVHSDEPPAVEPRELPANLPQAASPDRQELALPAEPVAPFDVFHFDGYMVRSITGANGEPWWLATDVCGILGLGNVGQAVDRIDCDEVDDIITDDVAGRLNRFKVINESGLYSLILTSRKPEAKRFKKWVTSEVLPSLRRKGAYSIPGVLPANPGGDTDPLTLALESALVIRRQQAALQQDVREIRDEQLQLTHQISEANARASEAEARAAEANARAAEAEDRARQTQAQISENEIRIAEANATAARSHAESLRATQEATRAVKTVTGEAGFFCLIPWAQKHGIHLTPPHDSEEGKACKALCDADGITPGWNRQARYDVRTYPEHILFLWLESYRMRHPRTGGPTLFNGTD